MGYNSVVTQVAKESIKEKSSSQAENMSCRNAFAERNTLNPKTATKSSNT